MKKRIKLLLAVTLSIAAVVGLGIGGAALAAGPNGNASETAGYCDFGPGDGTCSQAVLDLLGLTEDEVHAQRLEGLSLVEIAATQNVTEQELIDTIMAEREATVLQSVNDGTLTQDQADLILEHMEENVTAAVNRTVPGGAGYGHGYGESGLGTGPGLMHQYGSANGGHGACYGETGSGTGPGMMRHWGAVSR